MKRETFPPIRKWPELHRWPVHRDFTCCTKPVAIFDTNSEAIDFVNANVGRANFYIGIPIRRKR